MKRILIAFLTVVFLLTHTVAFADGTQVIPHDSTSSSGGGGGGGGGAGLAIAGVLVAGLLIYLFTGDSGTKPTPPVEDQTPGNVNQKEVQKINQPNTPVSPIGTDKSLEY
ncbi:MAG: hypothetical protein KGI88_01820 [Betaproteobacteria bacterium]|nr:hypothetical protein [Betaproteobacteria bacterium]MDE2055955.1 hypothetical protein [Betaproteobacteria bacterium]